jgi:transcription-repair coupling factor (superfamily II helicase)
MAGIKDVSYIETPPAGRQQISTMLAEYDDKTVYDAIMHEISRGGQVFYIYNKVETIETRVERLRKMMPAARFDFLHGQMPAAAIEKKMLSFLRDEFDCLVSTTIIEAGLDIPNVNTIIIDEAEDLGLGQLYQLRGRVGRSKIKAYSYLLYRKENLTENGRKRLAAINEFTKLGSGFQLALKDLQIRGAGELLGKRQHGYIDSVGLDMYTRLLEQYAADFKGIERKTEQAAEISIPVDAVIPDDYINNETTRIEFYRKLAIAADTAEIESEMNDRFGPLPRETVNLIGVNRVRRAAQKLGIEKIDSGPDSVTIKFSPETGIEPARVLEALKGRNFRFIKGDLLEITFDQPLEQEKNLAWIELILKSIK